MRSCAFRGKCYLNLRWIDPQRRLGWQCLHLFCRKKSLKGCCNLSQWGAIFGKWAAITLQQHSSTQHCVLKDILGISNKKLNHKFESFNGNKKLVDKNSYLQNSSGNFIYKAQIKIFKLYFLCVQKNIFAHCVYDGVADSIVWQPLSSSITYIPWF